MRINLAGLLRCLGWVHSRAKVVKCLENYFELAKRPGLWTKIPHGSLNLTTAQPGTATNMKPFYNASQRANSFKRQYTSY